MSIQPIKNFDELSVESINRLTADKDNFASPSIIGYNPFIYGNDVDSVDVATRIAMVRFFNSPNMLGNLTEHTRTLRLYPRPIVAFQTCSFLRSRSKQTSFVNTFARSQALECFAEWILMPANIVYQRVQQTTFDPKTVGDKAKWFAMDLEPIKFKVWDDQSSLNSLLKSIKNQEEQETDESGSDSEALSTSSSCSSLSDLMTELVSENEKKHSNDTHDNHYSSHHQQQQQHNQREVRMVDNSSKTLSSQHILPTGLDASLFYHPPKRLALPGMPLYDEEDSKSESTNPLSGSPEEPMEHSSSDVEDNFKGSTESDSNKADDNEDDVFVSESEDNSESQATTKTMVNSLSNLVLGTGNGSVPQQSYFQQQQPHHQQQQQQQQQQHPFQSHHDSPTFGSDFSIASLIGSETAGSITPLNSKYQSKVGSKASSSSGGSQGSMDKDMTDDVAQELFHSIEQFTMQAKQAAENAAETFDFVNTKKSLRASKDAATSKIDDISKSAISKKNEFFKAFGEPVSSSSEEKTDPPETTTSGKIEGLVRRRSRDFIRALSREILVDNNVNKSAQQPPQQEVEENKKPLVQPTTTNHRIHAITDDKLAKPISMRGQSLVSTSAESCSLATANRKNWRFHHDLTPEAMAMPPNIVKRTSPRPSVIERSSTILPKPITPRPTPPPLPKRPHTYKASSVGMKETLEAIKPKPPPVPKRNFPLPPNVGNNNNNNITANPTQIKSEGDNTKRKETTAMNIKNGSLASTAITKSVTEPDPIGNGITTTNNSNHSSNNNNINNHNSSNGSAKIHPKATSPSQLPKLTMPTSNSKVITRLSSSESSSNTSPRPLFPSSTPSPNLSSSSPIIKRLTSLNSSPAGSPLREQQRSGTSQSFSPVRTNSFKDEQNKQPQPSHSPRMVRSNSTLSGTSVLSQHTHEFFSSIGSDLNTLASQTTTIIGDLFGSRPTSPSGSSNWDTSSAKSVQLYGTPTKQGPLQTRGQKALAERSSLIRHPGSRQKQQEMSRYQDQLNDYTTYPMISADNNHFIRELIDQVLQGNGIGWLKSNRLRKLMEDELYRNFTLNKLNKSINIRCRGDSYLEDICLERACCKGIVKIFMSIIHGIETSVVSGTGGGIASTFHLMELAHTLYWAKLNNEFENDASSVCSSHVRDYTTGGSTISSPSESNENLTKMPSPKKSWASSFTNAIFQHDGQMPTGPESPHHHTSPQSNSVGMDNERTNSISSPLSRVPQLELGGLNGGKLFHDSLSSPAGSLKSGCESSNEEVNVKSMLQHKKAMLKLHQGASLDSNISEDLESESTSLACSESGSLMTNPAFRNVIKAADTRSVMSDSELNQGHFSVLASHPPDMLLPRKSSISAGYRFREGHLIRTGHRDLDTNSSRTYVFEGLLMNVRGMTGTGFSGGYRRGSLSLSSASYGPHEMWDNMDFWENVFCDAVAIEREAIAMDSGASELMDRYNNLSLSERRRLEAEEDKLLATMLYNLTAFMIMMQVNKQEIKKKVRRLLGKCHIGLIHSQEINILLENISNLNGNDIDLLPLPSKHMSRQNFTVHTGTDSSGDVVFMEVGDEGIILRSINGNIIERWFYEKLVNMTFSPKTKVLCLWRRVGGQTQLNKYHTKKCKELYYSIKEALERAAAKGSGEMGGINMELGGEFPVEDLNTGEGGLLQVCMEGVGLLFANSKSFVRLDHIRKCFTQKGGIFIMEEFNPNTKLVAQKRYKSAMADQICYSVLCVFSYVAAGQKQRRPVSVSSSKQLQQNKLGTLRKF